MFNHLFASFRIPLITLFISLGSIYSYSQISQPRDINQKEVKPLDIMQIPDFGRDTRSLISDIQNIVNDTEKLNAILPGLNDVLVVLSKKDSALMDTLNLFRLDALDKEERELELFNQRVTQWKEVILDYSNLGQNKDSVATSMINIWQSTLDSIRLSEKQTPATRSNTQNSNDFKDEILNFISNLEESQKILHTYLKQISNVQTEITRAENKIGNISDLIASRRSQLKTSIWMADYPAVWKVKRDTAETDRMQRIEDIIQADSSIIRAFLKNNPMLPYYFAIFILLVFALLMYLRPRAASLYKDYQKEFKEAVILLKYPLLSALIITWLCSVLFTFFPRELRDLIALIMFLPLVILLKKLNHKWRWHTVLWFSFSYIMFLVVKEIDYTHLPQRIFLILLNTLTTFLFIQYKKFQMQRDKSDGFWFGTLPYILNVFIVLGIISLIASISGNVQLALLLVYVSLGMFVVIHALRTAILLVQSLIFLVLMGPLLKYSFILKEDGQLVLMKMGKLFKFIGNLFLIYLVLQFLNIREVTFKAVGDVLNYQIHAGELSISLGNILAFFITLQIAIWISSFTRYILEKEVFPRTSMKQGVPNTILILIKFTLTILGVLFAFSAAGLHMDKLSIALGALGVGIGFGLQNIISNFISGIILAVERPITIGDLIEITDVSGVVKDIGIRASTVRTWDGSDVIVPNAELISNKLTNWTFFDRLRRVKTEVRVPFDTDIESVSQLLLSTASKIPEVVKTPKPYLNFKGIGTSAMEITLYCWIDDSDKIFSYGTAIRKAVFKALQDAGYDIPVPVQDLNITSK